MSLFCNTKVHMDFASMYLHIPQAHSKLIQWRNTGDDFLTDGIFYCESFHLDSATSPISGLYRKL